MTDSDLKSCPRAAKRRKMSPGTDPPTSDAPSNSDLDTATPLSDSVAIESSSSSQVTPSNGHALVWPSSKIPVELFTLIAKYVSHEDLKNMRFVNREFDHKLAEHFFSVVVVPFRPDFESFYGSLHFEPDEQDDGHQSFSVKATDKDTNSACCLYHHQETNENRNVSLLAGGHRVFQQFGAKIRKFALALELDEAELAFPPRKISQRIVKTAWGVYRWPVKGYQRYSRMENLELLADETNSFSSRNGPAVFRSRGYGDGTFADVEDDDSAPNERSKGPLFLWILKQMALISGCSMDDWPKLVLHLLENESRPGIIDWVQDALPSGQILYRRVPTLQVDQNTTNEDIIRHIRTSLITHAQDDDAGDLQMPALIPNSLTTAQAEMLLELGWAHSALMQSYRFAVLRNKDSFKNLRQLTIARCPSAQISSWCNVEFWETMTSIETFNLGVIPNWRRINKDVAGMVTEEPVSPTAACIDVFNLLQYYVGESPNVKNVSFEWLCGGEFGIGKCQRDRWILPAPVLPEINFDPCVGRPLRAHQILDLRHVKQLPLKNCWFAPHVFLLFCKHMFMDALTDITLESVSLSGPHTTQHVHPIYPLRSLAQGCSPDWPWPLCVGAQPCRSFQLIRSNTVTNLGGLIPVIVPTVSVDIRIDRLISGSSHGATPLPANYQSAVSLQAPSSANTLNWRLYSWPHILSSLGMASEAVQVYLENGGVTSRNRHERESFETEEFIDSVFHDVLEGREYKPKRRVMKFKSCGYVLVDIPCADNWSLIPTHTMDVHHTRKFCSRLKELDQHMLSGTRNVFAMAKIINYMPNREMWQLNAIFGLEFGWNGLYEDVVTRAAKQDGNPYPGRARFHGELRDECPSE